MVKKKILRRGDSYGNGRIVKFQMPSGLEIISFPTENPYGGQWDLGPTWNYVVMADNPFLIDTGRWNQGRNLIAMMKDVGLNPADLQFVLISHGHEDHDGGLSDLAAITGLRIKAHVTYELLRRPYPELSPEGNKKDFPARCWHCFMPESFYAKNCLGYHEFLRKLNVETIGDGSTTLGTDIRALHLPGHSPDSLAVQFGEEAVIVGDILLPDITPWPTSLEMYERLRPVLNDRYPDSRSLFGLGRYIKSLKELMSLGKKHAEIAVFPAHRLYYHDQWNCFELTQRVKELLEHHIQRCSDILHLISSGYKRVDEIVIRHFEESKLKGAGIHLARNEIISHCELMIESGDLIEEDDYIYSLTGKDNYINIFWSDYPPP